MTTIATRDVDDTSDAGPRPEGRAASVTTWFVRHRLLLVLLAFAVVQFLYSYMQESLRPGASSELGWNGWADQLAHRRSAIAIHHWDLDPKQHYYPVGYAMTAAPFVGLFPKDPFLPVNLVSFVAVVGLFFSTARRYVGRQFAFVGSLLFVAATPLLWFSVVPWSTTSAIVTVAWWSYTILGRRRLDILAVVVGGLLLGWTYMARGGGELVLLAPFGAGVVWQHRRDPRFLRNSAVLVAILVAIVGLNALWMHAIYDSLTNPYLSEVMGVGFVIGEIPSSFWGTIVYSGRTGDYWKPLLEQALWFAFAPVGVCVALRGKDRTLHVGLVASVVLGLLVVSAFEPFEAEGLQFHCLHYIKLWFPVLGLYALIGLRRIVDAPSQRPLGTGRSLRTGNR